MELAWGLTSAPTGTYVGVATWLGAGAAVSVLGRERGGVMTWEGGAPTTGNWGGTADEGRPGCEKRGQVIMGVENKH